MGITVGVELVVSYPLPIWTFAGGEMGKDVLGSY